MPRPYGDPVEIKTEPIPAPPRVLCSTGRDPSTGEIHWRLERRKATQPSEGDE